MTEAVIFDMDGTLCDTLDDLQTAMNEMLRSFGWKERSKEELLGFINRGTRVFVGLSLPDGTANSFDEPIVDEAINKYCKAYSECFARKTHEYPGITEALHLLKHKGLKLAVLSNKNDDFVNIISNKLFPGLFDLSRGYIKGAARKPDPAAVTEVCEKLGVLPENCVYVGDSDIDMKTAAASGMYPLGVSWGYRPSGVLVDAGAKSVANSAEEMQNIVLTIKNSLDKS